MTSQPKEQHAGNNKHAVQLQLQLFQNITAGLWELRCGFLHEREGKAGLQYCIPLSRAQREDHQKSTP